MTTRLLAVSTDAGVELRIYTGDDLIRAVQLEPKQALLLALDLLNLVAGVELRIDRIAAPLWGVDRWGRDPDLG
jgi:hypothetical protein